MARWPGGRIFQDFGVGATGVLQIIGIAATVSALAR